MGCCGLSNYHITPLLIVVQDSQIISGNSPVSPIPTFLLKDSKSVRFPISEVVWYICNCDNQMSVLHLSQFLSQSPTHQDKKS